MELSCAAMFHRVPALAVALMLAFGCGSDPLAPAPSEGGGSGSGGSSGAGSGGTGGGKDYATSPCYGQTRSTKVYDFSTHMTRDAAATCRAEGERTLVYVTDELWNNPFTQADVNAFMAGYELAGRPMSHRPDLGVLPVDELVFGSLDGPLNAGRLTDGKLPIFVVSSGGAGDGYLCGWCEQVELHLDGPLLRSLYSDKALSIAAHESVHAIHRGYDADETVWVDETLAQAAMTANGFFTDQVWLDSFLNQTNVAWGPGVEDPREFHYGAGLLFGSYLWERGGPELLAAIVQEPRDGWAGIDAALSSVGDEATGFDLFMDMALSLYLDDPVSGYAFDAFELEDAVQPVAVATGTSYGGTLFPYGLVYVALDASASSLTLDAPTSVSAKLVLDGNPPGIGDLAPGRPTVLVGAARLLVLTATATAEFTLAVE
jgi:hypothetical protein